MLLMGSPLKHVICEVLVLSGTKAQRGYAQFSSDSSALLGFEEFRSGVNPICRFWCYSVSIL